MSKVRLYGDTSGYVDLKAPDVAGDVTITLPNTTGPFATETYVDSAVAAIPEIAGIGSNVVSTTKTDVFSASSLAPTLVPVTGLTATITPTTATSKVLVIVTLSASHSITGHPVVVQVLRDGTPVAQGDADGSRSRRFGSSGEIGGSQGTHAPGTNTYIALDSPATTSSVTYSVSISGTGTVTETFYVNRGQSNTDSSRFVRGASTITAIEVAA